jgi:hypothetical protein
LTRKASLTKWWGDLVSKYIKSILQKSFSGEIGYRYSVMICEVLVNYCVSIDGLAFGVWAKLLNEAAKGLRERYLKS